MKRIKTGMQSHVIIVGDPQAYPEDVETGDATLVIIVPSTAEAEHLISTYFKERREDRIYR